MHRCFHKAAAPSKTKCRLCFTAERGRARCNTKAEARRAGHQTQVCVCVLSLVQFLSGTQQLHESIRRVLSCRLCGCRCRRRSQADGQAQGAFACKKAQDEAQLPARCRAGGMCVPKCNACSWRVTCWLPGSHIKTASQRQWHVKQRSPLLTPLTMVGHHRWIRCGEGLALAVNHAWHHWQTCNNGPGGDNQD